jgi:hypothetical protein
LKKQIIWPYRSQKEREIQKIRYLCRTFDIYELSKSRIWLRGITPITDCNRRLLVIPLKFDGLNEFLLFFYYYSDFYYLKLMKKRKFQINY